MSIEEQRAERNRIVAELLKPQPPPKPKRQRKPRGKKKDKK